MDGTLVDSSCSVDNFQHYTPCWFRISPSLNTQYGNAIWGCPLSEPKYKGDVKFIILKENCAILGNSLPYVINASEKSLAVLHFKS